MTFETLILPAEFYSGLVEFSVKMILIICLMMMAASFFSKRIVGRILVPLMWYVNIPKIFISLLAVILVFCYDYNTKTIRPPKFDNMYVSTFLVGILALIEILSAVASMIKDAHDLLDSNNNIE